MRICASRNSLHGGTAVALLLAATAALLVALILFLARARPRGPVTGKKYLASPVGTVAGVDRFVWNRPKGAVRFYLELFEQNGTLLWSQATADTTLALPARLGLSTNRVYRWRVTYTFADGVSLSTNDESFMIPPGISSRP
jgi:hypothetical protein